MSSAMTLFHDLQSLSSNSDPATVLDDFVVYCKASLGSVERVHFDFKEKRDPRAASLDDSDKKNLAKAVSGFANSEGGVLIWGIEDRSLDPRPITDVADFVDAVMQLCHQVTSPAVIGIDGFHVTDGTSPARGFGVIYIPESVLPPHRTILNITEIKDRYFVRSGSSFTPASHAQLEDMFGRRPKSNLKVQIRKQLSGIDLALIISIKNEGRGIAKHPYFSLMVENPFGIARFGIDGNGKTGLKMFDFTEQTGHQREYPDLGYAQFVSQDGQVIHSGMNIDVTSVRGTCGPSVAQLRMKVGLAAEGQPFCETTVEYSKSVLLSDCESLDFIGN